MLGGKSLCWAEGKNDIGVCSWRIFNDFSVPVKMSVLAAISFALSGPVVGG